MGSFSIWHWIIVLVIVLLVFGTKKLKNIGTDLIDDLFCSDKIASSFRHFQRRTIFYKFNHLAQNNFELCLIIGDNIGRGG